MVEAIQERQRPHLHSFNQQRFAEEPGTVLSAEDPPTGQDRRQYSAPCRGHSEQAEKIHYWAVTLALKEKEEQLLS